MLKIHKTKCENIDILELDTTRTSPESHLLGKSIFIRTLYNLEYMQISKLIMKKIILI